MEIRKEDFEELRRLEESLWLTVTRFDREHMEQILSPDFFEFGSSGSIYKREDTLAAPTQEIKAKLPLTDFQVHAIAENVVLVTYVSEVTNNDGWRVANRSSTWVKTPDQWKLRFHQGTPVNE